MVTKSTAIIRKVLSSVVVLFRIIPSATTI